MPFGKSRMHVAVDSIVATRWCFRRSRRLRTWIRKRLHTSHIQILFPSLLKISMKDAVACATTGVQCLFAGRAGPRAMGFEYVVRYIARKACRFSDGEVGVHLACRPGAILHAPTLEGFRVCQHRACRQSTCAS